MSDLIERQAAIDGKISIQRVNGVEIYYDEAVPVEYLKALPPAQPEPFLTIKHAGSEHPLSDSEIIPRLREIRDQVGGSYAIDRAIELLTAQPEPCEDAVSRKAAIDGLNDAVHEHNITDFDAVATILALPPVTPKQRWIPVTERLPEEDDYRPCCGYEDGAVWWRNDMGLMGLGWYYPSTGKWAYYDESDRCEKCVENVVEWMQLPRREGDAE